MTRMKIAGVVAMALCAWLSACSGGEDAGDDETSSSGGSSGSSGGSSGASSGGPACGVLGHDVLANEPKELSNLSLTGSTLVFVSGDLSLATPPSIEKIAVDGSGRAALHVPTGTRRVLSARAVGDRVYFLEEETNEPIPAPELWSLPLSGGAAARVGTGTFREGRIFAADAENVYIARITDAPVGSVYDRVELASGSTVPMAVSPPGTGTPTQISLSENDVFFMAGTIGAQAGKNQLYRLDKNLEAQTATGVLPNGLSDLCDFTLGGIYATTTKIGCGFSALRAGNRDGSGVTELVAKEITKPAANILVGSDAERFYLYDSTGQDTKTGNLRTITSAGAEITPIACDLGRIQNRLFRAFFPIQPEYEVIVGATDVFWVEAGGSQDAPRWTLRRATK